MVAVEKPVDSIDDEMKSLESEKKEEQKKSKAVVRYEELLYLGTWASAVFYP